MYLSKVEELERKKQDVDEGYLSSFWGRLGHFLKLISSLRVIRLHIMRKRRGMRCLKASTAVSSDTV